MAALMTLEQGNTEKIGAFRQELTRLNIELSPPDINISSSEFIVEPRKNSSSRNAIRYALSAIKNVGIGAVEEIVAERNNKGSYKSLFDFSIRLGKVVLNKRQFASLAKAGAFDQMNSNRAQVVEASDMLIRYGDWLADEAEGGQASLFQDSDADHRQPDLPLVEEWAPFDRLREEAEALGFYLSSHPLDAYGSSISDLGIVAYSTLLSSLSSGNRIERAKLAAVVQKRRERNSNRGRYAFLEVSDQSAIYEITIFSDLLSRKRDFLEVGAALLVEVSVQREGDSVRLTAQKIDALDDKIVNFNNGFMVYLKEKSELNSLKAVIERDEGGGGQLWLVQRLAKNLEVEIGLSGRYSVSPALRAALKSVPGVIDVLDR